MKKLLLLGIVAIALCGCGSSHKCGIKAAKVCGSDNVSYSLRGVFGGCSFKCSNYSKFTDEDTPKEKQVLSYNWDNDIDLSIWTECNKTHGSRSVICDEVLNTFRWE